MLLRWPTSDLLNVNAGHGGGGVTLAWGCAREAVLLVQEVLAR